MGWGGGVVGWWLPTHFKVSLQLQLRLRLSWGWVGLWQFSSTSLSWVLLPSLDGIADKPLLEKDFWDNSLYSSFFFFFVFLFFLCSKSLLLIFLFYLLLFLITYNFFHSPSWVFQPLIASPHLIYFFLFAPQPPTLFINPWGPICFLIYFYYYHECIKTPLLHCYHNTYASRKRQYNLANEMYI